MESLILHLLEKNAFVQQILCEGRIQKPLRYLICAKRVTVLHVAAWHTQLQHALESIDALVVPGCTCIQRQLIGNMHHGEFLEFYEVA